jgi:hypothetical protein
MFNKVKNEQEACRKVAVNTGYMLRKCVREYKNMSITLIKSQTIIHDVYNEGKTPTLCRDTRQICCYQQYDLLFVKLCNFVCWMIMKLKQYWECCYIKKLIKNIKKYLF